MPKVAPFLKKDQKVETRRNSLLTFFNSFLNLPGLSATFQTWVESSTQTNFLTFPYYL
jgi:hypothetical protein